MKNSIQLITVFLLLGFSIQAQVELRNVQLDKTYVIYTHDKAEFIGRIISHDKSEVIISTSELGEVSVPTYQIKELKELDKTDLSPDGEYLKDNLFATRYFLTSNGLDIKKGDAYILLNWFGPDVQYGLADNFSVGVMSTWIGSPVIATMKYSFNLNKSNSIGIGTLVGTLGWTSFEIGGALPFVSYTVGDRKTNLTASLGYGAIWHEGILNDVNGATLMSFAGMARANNALTFVFDSFIVPGFSEDNNSSAILIPGIRFQKKEGIALQLGIAGIIAEEYSYYNESSSYSTYALPMAQLFFKF